MNLNTMSIGLRPATGALQTPAVPRSNLLAKIQFTLTSPSNRTHLSLLHLTSRPRTPISLFKARRSSRDEAVVESVEAEVEAEVVDEEAGDEFSSPSGFRGRDEKDYDRDPELAEILGSCFDDPQKAQARVEERIRSKRSRILHAKTGSATPVKVIFDKFEFSNSCIWFEFYNAPLPKDVSLISDTIRSWYIIGRLGGCNSMNMQLSQSPLDTKRPNYDAIQGANVTPTTFYNIGDLEIQDNLACIWVDVGTSEPLLLDVLINALTCISSDYVGIKQVVFGGSGFENWKENLTSDDPAYSIHKI